MSGTPLPVAVIGTGYVGLTTGACLAHLGHHVTCVDVDPEKIDELMQGRITFVEDGLEALVADGRVNGNLTGTTDPAEGVRDAEVVFLCVPTPQDDAGSADLTYVEAAAATIGPHLRAGAIVVNKSTVPVGSFHIVSDALGRVDVDVVSNPEFLREGSAVHDFLHPDRVVIGADDVAVAEKVRSLYESLDTTFLITDPASAETIKYAANGFLAMKISFINSVAVLCEQVGADIRAVADGIGSDHRIGPAFLAPGPGWGGSCFPKDSSALVSIAADHGYDFSLMRGVIDINEQQHERMVYKVIRALGRFEHDRLTGKVVAALGLTFKAGTDDLRESPALRIVGELTARGATIRAYDPTTVGELHEHQRNALSHLELVDSPFAAARGADLLLILTEWPEYGALDLARIAEVMRGADVVDCRNMLDRAEVRSAGLRYEGVGRR